MNDPILWMLTISENIYSLYYVESSHSTFHDARTELTGIARNAGMHVTITDADENSADYVLSNGDIATIYRTR